MANTAPLAESRLEDVFLPQEHALISYYLLRPTPKGTPSIQEVTGYFSQKKWRESASIYIAHIATGGSWDAVRDQIVCNIAKYRPPIQKRNILFVRQVLFSVVWGGSRMGWEWKRAAYADLPRHLPAGLSSI